MGEGVWRHRSRARAVVMCLIVAIDIVRAVQHRHTHRSTVGGVVGTLSPTFSVIDAEVEAEHHETPEQRFLRMYDSEGLNVGIERVTEKLLFDMFPSIQEIESELHSLHIHSLERSAPHTDFRRMLSGGAIPAFIGLMERWGIIPIPTELHDTVERAADRREIEALSVLEDRADACNDALTKKVRSEYSFADAIESKAHKRMISYQNSNAKAVIKAAVQSASNNIRNGIRHIHSAAHRMKALLRLAVRVRDDSNRDSLRSMKHNDNSLVTRYDCPLCGQIILALQTADCSNDVQTVCSSVTVTACGKGFAAMCQTTFCPITEQWLTGNCQSTQKWLKNAKMIGFDGSSICQKLNMCDSDESITIPNDAIAANSTDIYSGRSAYRNRTAPNEPF